MSLFSLFQPRPRAQDHAIRKGKALLRPHKKAIREIRAIVGIPRRHWEALYLATLVRLAEYLQATPASEAHHHSHAGGLLEHTIETALNALRIRRGKLLPPNTDAETVTRFKDVWTYATFTGALGHDLGKPITDLQIELLDKKRSVIGPWSPFQGPMTLDQRARYYRIQYRRNRVHGAHERASALYIHHIVPTIGIEWIASEPELFMTWTNLLTGHSEDTGIIGSIIHEADKLSVAANLAGDQVHLPAAAQTRRKPLHQRIVTALRHQIDEGALPLNRDGAAGWVADGKLWMVVKRTLDQLRERMNQEGQTGIPARNDRIMDELQQYGLLIPNGNKAVWKCQVFAPEWPKAHELTMLCIPLEKVWPNADGAPEAFDGSVTPIETAGATSSPSDTEKHQVTPAAPPPAPPQTASGSNRETDDGAAPAVSITETEAMPTQTEKPSIEPPSIDFTALVSPADGDTEDGPVKPDAAPAPAVEQHRGPDKPSTAQGSESGVEDTGNAGQDFLNWLRDGLHEKRFAVNDVNAKIHMTKEGIFLVSPAIFKQYDKKRWSYVQKRFTKLRLHEKSSNSTNIHEYVASGKKKRSVIKGFLITDTDNVFPGIELPGINHALSKLTD